MSLLDFLDNTATFTRRVVTNDDGIEKETPTTIYTSIPCHIYKYRGSVIATSLSVNTTDNLFSMIVEPTRTNIRQGDYIVVSDPNLTIENRYEVYDQPKANRDSDNEIDSIQFICKRL